MKLVLASKNAHKLVEMRDILSQLGVEVVLESEVGVDVDVEETGATFEENAFLKARAVMEASGLPAIADDSGLCVDALNGAPGVYSARYGGPELGDTLVTCATIVQSYLLLITMPMGGLTLGSQPVVSFNYGAANLERIKRAIQSIVALCVTFCVLMTVVTHTLSPVFVGLFTQNPEVAARSVRYIKVFTAMIIPLAIQYPLVDETTALGHVRLALFCSIFRKCVFLAGLLLLPALVSPEATFLSEPIADVVAATVTTCLFLHFFPKILAQRAAREREEREEQPKVAP